MGQVTTRTYDAWDNVTATTDPNGVTTTNTYDGDENLLAIETPLDATHTATTAYTYDAHGNELTETDPEGRVTTSTYSARGLLASRADADGDTTTYTEDIAGDVLTAVAPRGNAPGASPSHFRTSRTYDDAGDLISETTPNGKTTSATYDGDSQKVTSTDADGDVTTYDYDAANKLTMTTRPDGTTLTATYDPDGNQLTQANGDGEVTSHHYDALVHLDKITNADNQQTAYQYDAVGNLLSVTELGVATGVHGLVCVYDASDRLVGEQFSVDASTRSVSFTYDDNGNRLTMTDPSGISSYDYDALNRLTDQTNGAGQHVGYEYDLSGDPITITYPNGHGVAEAYDDAGRLSSVTDWLGNETDFGYNADGNVTHEVFPSETGETDSSTYNREDQMTSVEFDSTGGSLAKLSFTFLKEGRATTAEYYWTARNAANAAGGQGTAAGDAAFEASLVTSFTNGYNTRTSTYWTVAPSNPTTANLFGNANTYTRPGLSYLALRAILGPTAYDAALHHIQSAYGGGTISEPHIEREFHAYMPNQSLGCANKLDAFFTQWWDTAYPAGGGVNRPQITGPGLPGGGFYDADGGCSDYGVDATQPIGGSVGATLALTLGAPATFGEFTPGLAKDYVAATSAGVTSTAGDATLAVADPDAAAPGHLVNGGFSLPRALQAKAGSAAGSATAGGSVDAAPLPLLTYSGPTTNDAVTIGLTQSIGATDALRTGSYGKTLTFTLATTTP